METSLVLDLARIINTDHPFTARLSSSLELLGRHFDVSHCFYLDPSQSHPRHSFPQWCAQKSTPHAAEAFEKLYSLAAIYIEGMGTGESITVFTSDDFTSEHKKQLQILGFQNLILVPVCKMGCPCGVLGMDVLGVNHIWSRSEIELCQILSNIIFSSALLDDKIYSFPETQNNFRILFDTIEDIIFIGDLQGKLIFANQASVRKLGYPLEDLVNMNIIDLHPNEVRTKASERLEAIFHRELDRFEMEMLCKDGHLMRAETRLWFGKWSGQEAIFGIAKDVSGEQAALAKFESLFRNNPLVMILSGVQDQKFRDVNHAFTEKFGYSFDEAVGRSAFELGMFLDPDGWRVTRQTYADNGYIRNQRCDFVKKDGSKMHGIISGDAFMYLGQKYLLTVITDLTEIITLQNSLAIEQNRLRNVIDGTNLGIWEWDLQTGEIVINERWAEINGFTLDELEPTNLDTWKNLLDPEEYPEIVNSLQRHFRGETEYYECEYRMRQKNGSWVWVQDRGKVIERDVHGKPLKMYGSHADITEKKLMEEKIHELSIRDPLTEAYNRRYTDERLTEIIAEYVRRDRNFSVTIIDIDHFKKVNDRYGHQAGDFVLKEFSRKVIEQLRPYDLLGRYGGEEFILINTSAGREEAASLMERLMNMVRTNPVQYKGIEISFSFSAGIAEGKEFSRDGFYIDEIVALADKRLYQAKYLGRNRWVDHDIDMNVNTGIDPSRSIFDF